MINAASEYFDILHQYLDQSETQFLALLDLARSGASRATLDDMAIAHIKLLQNYMEKIDMIKILLAPETS